MEVIGGKAVIHVTEVGGCILKALKRAYGVPIQDKYYHSQLGTAVHRVNQRVMEGVLQGEPVDIPLAMEGVYQRHYKGTDMFWDVAQRDIQEKVRRLAEWLEWNQGMEIEQVEYNMTATLPWSIGGMEAILSGTLDILTPTQVIDLKSGKSRDPHHVRQVAAYSLLLNKELEGRVVYLGSEKWGYKLQKNGKRHCYHERVVERERMVAEAGEFSDALHQYASELDQHWGREPEAEDCPDCYYCAYRTGCWGSQSEGGYKGE